MHMRFILLFWVLLDSQCCLASASLAAVDSSLASPCRARFGGAAPCRLRPFVAGLGLCWPSERGICVSLIWNALLVVLTPVNAFHLFGCATAPPWTSVLNLQADSGPRQLLKLGHYSILKRDHASDVFSFAFLCRQLTPFACAVRSSYDYRRSWACLLQMMLSLPAATSCFCSGRQESFFESPAGSRSTSASAMAHELPLELPS